MFKYSNPHPRQKKVGDCVKRAIVHATGKQYQEVSLELNRLKKETNARQFNDNVNWKSYVAKMGWKKMSFPAESGKPRMNGNRFCLAYPKGVFVLSMAHHLTCVVDGQILDTWDCGEKCVYNAWEVK